MAIKRDAATIAGHKAAICEAIAEGKSLVQTLKAKGMPGYTAVMNWLREDEDFAASYARAREAQADADADKISFIASEVAAGNMDPQAARVAIDALKWTAGKRQPKKYGDKLDMNISGKVEVERVEIKFVGDGE
ncbi:hypothetical protein [Paracoccus shanxieyensis]|uniref:Terminase small subunit n=1 Tax=Paracoccus shanxieyensis TaxID=2675752 RepID=A0A6L6IZL8_9RHOB|nr:hypothetical protein [Paracoccus shanxieyensis]MTH65061.1 hypothetical protein [Paracoccus shanxieyensis]MTH88205.1 hypothetical protein [Paracoccus shanxieyensis]